jgi:methylaspartate ammonia-lyase
LISLSFISRILQAAGNRNLSRQMQHCSRSTHRLDHGDRISDITGDDSDEIAVTGFQPVRVFPNARSRKIIERNNPGTAVRQGISQVAADEAASAGNQDWAVEIISSHATSPRLASSSVARST